MEGEQGGGIGEERAMARRREGVGRGRFWRGVKR